MPARSDTDPDFVAIDVETADSWPGSICQIGIVEVAGGRVRSEWSTLVDPEGPFSPFNIRIHGILPERVRGAPAFDNVYEELFGRLEGATVVSHTAFDRNAVRQACERYALAVPSPRWLDSAAVARRAWPDRFAKRGYALPRVAEWLGIRFRHHDALEDARAAAEIVLAAERHTGLDVEGWIRRVRQPVRRRRSDPQTHG